MTISHIHHYFYHTAWEVKRNRHRVQIPCTHGGTCDPSCLIPYIWLLSNSPAHYLAEASPQTNYDTSQLYHGFLIVWVVPSSGRASPSKEDIVNFRMVQSPRSHGTTTAYMVVKFVAIVLMDNCPKYHVHYLYMHPSAGNYPVKNWIIASRWMHINWYKLASRQVSLLTH